jgi:hypothetical protein
MHAVIVTMDIHPGRAEESRQGLHDFVIPNAKGRDGFVSGTWFESDDRRQAVGVVLMATAEQARQIGDDAAGAPEDAPVAFRSAEVLEVVGSA